MASEIEIGFERAVDALALDAAFGGVEIVERRAHRRGGVFELAIVVDRDGGVDVATCERVSAAVNAALAAYEDRYELFVASAGLERPLVRPEDYERFRDREVVVTTSVPIDHEYTHRGRLAGLREDAAIVLDPKRGEIAIPLHAVKAARLVYDPRSDLQREKSARVDRRRDKRDRRERGA